MNASENSSLLYNILKGVWYLDLAISGFNTDYDNYTIEFSPWSQSEIFSVPYYSNIFLPFFVEDRLIGLPEGRARNHNRPQQVPGLSGIHIQDVAVGAEHTLVLSSTGDVYTWGSNSEGQVTCIQCLWEHTCQSLNKTVCCFSYLK